MLRYVNRIWTERPLSIVKAVRHFRLAVAESRSIRIHDMRQETIGDELLRVRTDLGVAWDE